MVTVPLTKFKDPGVRLTLKASGKETIFIDRVGFKLGNLPKSLEEDDLSTPPQMLDSYLMVELATCIFITKSEGVNKNIVLGSPVHSKNSWHV